MDNSNERDLVIKNAIQQCCDIIFFSSSDGNEYGYVVHCLESIETKTAIPRLQNYVETILPQFNNGQFNAHFRMLSTTFEFVLTLIAPKLNRQSQVTNLFHQINNFLLQFGKWLIWTLTNQFVKNLMWGGTAVIVTLEILASAFITWPSEEKAEEIKNGFFSTRTFPNVVDAIDGTHINIPSPHDHQEAYVQGRIGL
ncbi:unnamed protein product [Macrosiphum euphorbiae]|uniref:Uncharacterized protein n=1 Tax=Macrosiphum euphorbiae TaxID=13131 RepID=A0AAV0XBU4_9HEMI|nr:unnamed protein product [Macrosiphum euphorbiae]